MATYQKTFNKAYENGWKNDPDKTTPIKAEALNAYDTSILAIENYLSLNEIPDISSKLNKIDYSKNEQDTGIKWIDGKNIYQKTFEFDMENVTTGTYSLFSEDFIADTVISIEGFSNTIHNYFTFPLIGASMTTQISAYYDKTNSKIIVSSNTDVFNGYKAYVTVRYTKTS